MIKAKVSTDYKDVERIFAGGSIQKEIIKLWSTEANAYVFEAWKILEMEGPLPLTITTNGEPLIDYRIYGNTVQTGTPTPENPITPIGCGERVDITGLSEPLCGIKTYTDNLNLSTGILTRRIKKFVFTGNEGILLRVKFANATAYSCRHYTDDALPYNRADFICSHFPFLASYEKQSDHIYQDVKNFYITSTQYRTVSDFKSYLAAQYAAGTPVTVWYVLAEPDVSTIPIPSGLTGTIEGYLIQDGTPTPETPIYPTTNGVKQADDTYAIPYGYKLPILSNSTVTNIYLGEVETTRLIKKLVLTGKEDWVKRTFSNQKHTFEHAQIFRIMVGLCSHYANYTAAYIDMVDGVYLSNTFRIIITDLRFTAVTDFMDYLAAQYAAGTPVTIWFALAEPETGVVNEPLMKIGNYVDTIDSTQSTVQIPTSKGTTTLDYDGGEKHLLTSDGHELVDKNQNGFLLSGSTLQPSKMYIKYKGR